MLEEVQLERLRGSGERATGRRRLHFAGAQNFRDLGGYATLTGQSVRWNRLYRSDALHKLTERDLRRLAALDLDRVIDFRAEHEQQREPDRLPAGSAIRQIAIPILDSSTRIWHEAREEFVKHLRDIDPVPYMIQTNAELATRFTPDFRRFFDEILAANGRPVLFHCAVGKDRTGFAAALLLRILGVPAEVVLQDYLLTNRYLLSSYRWNLAVATVLRGWKFARVIHGFMEANPIYLGAAFEALERTHGSFEAYVRHGLGLTEGQLTQLRTTYLK